MCRSVFQGCRHVLGSNTYPGDKPIMLSTGRIQAPYWVHKPVARRVCWRLLKVSALLGIFACQIATFSAAGRSQGIVSIAESPFGSLFAECEQAVSVVRDIIGSCVPTNLPDRAQKIHLTQLSCNLCSRIWPFAVISACPECGSWNLGNKSSETAAGSSETTAVWPSFGRGFVWVFYFQEKFFFEQELGVDFWPTKRFLFHARRSAQKFYIFHLGIPEDLGTILFD